MSCQVVSVELVFETLLLLSLLSIRRYCFLVFRVDYLVGARVLIVPLCVCVCVCVREESE